MNKDLLFNSEEIFTIHHSLFIIHSKRGCSSAGRAVPLQGIGQGFESPHLHQTFEEVSAVDRKMEVRKVLKEDQKNVDNRIQYVGQIASEGKHSRKKNQSQDINRVKKNESGRRTCSLHHVKSY